ncbi:MAG: VCBS repeat-containing protein [Ferruginibacter sp.]
MTEVAEYDHYSFRLRLVVAACIIALLLGSCKSRSPGNGNSPYFKLLGSSETNIDFNNKITESDSVNVYGNEYMYNGSGVGIGDFNNDGLVDIFFGGSMVSSKMYLNKGNFKFEDITSRAGVQTGKWITGVSVVDINADGFMDIYLCSSHSPGSEERENLLFINDGKLHFTEQAAQYGLADTGFSTQAAFFDYDKDGDLDMYLLNHRLYNINNNNLVPKDTSGNSPANDKLYRNDGVQAGSSHPHFTNVAQQAGIKEDGYGLGLVITDVNNDNWPDMYVANDYIGNDVLWLNNKNGTFSNIISTAIQHQSYNSMGADAADINNDGLADIAVLDMLPETNERKKMMFNASSQEKYDMQQRLGYEPSFVRNMLQLNNGIRKINNRIEPFYSEIGQLAGIAETDWSWSVLMADFDNDGWKDIHITNGLARDVTNNDYATFKNTQSQNGYFDTKEAVAIPDKNTVQLLRQKLDEFGSIKIDNYFFHNNSGLGFSNVTATAGFAIPSVSNGAGYADLDNDGDLDLVVNNMNQEAFIHRNETRKSIKDSIRNFIDIQLKGPAGNTSGIGSKVSLISKGTIQFLEQSPVRGFSSSVDCRLHFGVGNTWAIDSLKIEWPDDKVQVVKNVKANQLLIIYYKDAKEPVFKKEDSSVALFNDVTDQFKIAFTHKEAAYFDFGAQRAVPQKYSQLGPSLAAGDVNSDGMMDFFIGGAATQPGKIFIQNANKGFDSKNLVTEPKVGEDLGAVFFDSDEDQDLDLLITGGTTEFSSYPAYNQPRLYNNDGKGNFIINDNALPKGINEITKAVVVADYDGDGDMDIFIGGRLVPEKYPQSPRSYILQNDHGKFRDVTKDVCSLLQFPGLITGAVFTDFNNDNKPDLVICGEWMPVRFFVNQQGKLVETTEHTGLKKMNGQWRSLQAADLDKDGDMDFIAGNLGLNNKFNVSPETPLKLYAGDFDGNKFTDIVPAYFMKNNEGRYELFPALDRTQLADQLPSIKKKFLMHKDFAGVNMQHLLASIAVKDVVEKECQTTASVWIENLGNGHFKHHVLPLQAQFAPINTMLADDMDGDGITDILLAGNEYQEEVSTGRYDASYGLFLKGLGRGKFVAERPVKTGFIINGDVKAITSVTTRDATFIIAAVNNGAVRCFTIKKQVIKPH